jgi:hypothetical protein
MLLLHPTIRILSNKSISKLEKMMSTFCIISLKCFFFILPLGYYETNPLKCSLKTSKKLESGAHLLHHLLEMFLLHPSIRILSNKSISKLENGAHLLHHLFEMFLLHPSIRIFSNKSVEVLPHLINICIIGNFCCPGFACLRTVKILN